VFVACGEVGDGEGAVEDVQVGLVDGGVHFDGVGFFGNCKDFIFGVGCGVDSSSGFVGEECGQGEVLEKGEEVIGGVAG